MRPGLRSPAGSIEAEPGGRGSPGDLGGPAAEALKYPARRPCCRLRPARAAGRCSPVCDPSGNEIPAARSAVVVRTLGSAGVAAHRGKAECVERGDEALLDSAHQPAGAAGPHVHREVAGQPARAVVGGVAAAIDLDRGAGR